MIPAIIDSGLVHLSAHLVIRGLSHHDCYSPTGPEPAKCTPKREEFGPKRLLTSANGIRISRFMFH